MKDIIEHFRGLVDDETLELLSRYASGENVEIKETFRIRGVVIDIEEKLKIFSKDGISEIPLECCREMFKLGDVVRVKSPVIRSKSDFEVIGNVVRVIEGVFLGGIGSRFALNVGRDVLICMGNVECKRGQILRIEGFNVEDKFFMLNYKIVGKGNVECVWSRIEDISPLKVVNLRGRVSGLLGERFVKNRRTATIYISDESGRMRVVLVGDNAELYRDLDIGDWVEVYEGYVRIGYDGEIEVICDKGLAIKVF